MYKQLSQLPLLPFFSLTQKAKKTVHYLSPIMSNETTKKEKGENCLEQSKWPACKCLPFRFHEAIFKYPRAMTTDGTLVNPFTEHLTCPFLHSWPTHCIPLIFLSQPTIVRKQILLLDLIKIAKMLKMNSWCFLCSMHL